MCSVDKDDFAMVFTFTAIILGYRDALGIRRLIDSSFIDHAILIEALPIDKRANGAPS